MTATLPAQTLHFEGDETPLVDVAGKGSHDVKAFQAADYRMLVNCLGAPLEIRDATHVISRTLCDGVSLDAKVYADEGRKALRVVATAATSWSLQVARVPRRT